MDYTTICGVASLAIGVGVTPVFAFWQPQHPIIRGISIGVGILLAMGGFAALVFFAPIHWQFPIVLRSPILHDLKAQPANEEEQALRERDKARQQSDQLRIRI